MLFDKSPFIHSFESSGYRYHYLTILVFVKTRVKSCSFFLRHMRPNNEAYASSCSFFWEGEYDTNDKDETQDELYSKRNVAKESSSTVLQPSFFWEFIVLETKQMNGIHTALYTYEMKKRLDQREDIIATRYARTILLPSWGGKATSGWSNQQCYVDHLGTFLHR